jgi:hypothetical protein
MSLEQEVAYTGRRLPARERDREGKYKESYLHNNLTPQPRPAVRYRELSGGALKSNPPRSARSQRTSDEHRHASEVLPEENTHIMVENLSKYLKDKYNLTQPSLYKLAKTCKLNNAINI